MFVETMSEAAPSGPAPVGPESVRERERRLSQVEAQIAVVCGRLNALHGELVALVADAVALGAAQGHGLRSAGHWVAWQTGSTMGHGAAIARLAARRAELPVTVAKLAAGEISLDQATVIAARAPSWADVEAAGYATVMTPHQLQRVCAAYPQPSSRRRARSYGITTSTTDDGDVRIRGLVPGDVGAGFTTAMRAHRDALIDAHRTGTSPAEGDDHSARPTSVDALVRMIERSLALEARERPHYQRTKVIIHVDADRRHARFHLGPALSPELHRLYSCDATYQVVYERDGVPIGVGHTRTIPFRLRVAVEDRDGGCRVPGCTTRWVQLHHVTPAEDHGPTETWNLIAVCPHHHRLHHHDQLGITFTHPDHPSADDPHGITFTDHHGHTITGVATPTPPGSAPPGTAPPGTAPPGTAPGAPHGPPPPAPYQHPTGERLHTRDIPLNATPPPGPDPA